MKEYGTWVFPAIYTVYKILELVLNIVCFQKLFTEKPLKATPLN